MLGLADGRTRRGDTPVQSSPVQLSALRNLPAATARPAAACPVSQGSCAVSGCCCWTVTQPGGPRVFYTTGRERGKTELFPAGETKIFRSDHAQSRDPLTASSSLICTSTAVLLCLQLPGYLGSFLEIDLDISVEMT